MWWALFFMDISVTNSGPNDGSASSLSVEDRVDRLESQLWELRSLLRASGIVKGAQKDSHAITGNLEKVSPKGQPSHSIERWFSPFIPFVRNWVLGPLGIIRSVSWLRRMTILVLGAAILLSNWWLPLTSFWILGGIFERLVILVLAGIWWYLLVGGWSPFFRDKRRTLGKTGSTWWFGSRAS